MYDTIAIMSKKLKLPHLFLQLAKPNDKGFSNVITTNRFVDKYEKLKFGNGGSWCRKDSKLCADYKIATIKYNGKIDYKWTNVSQDDIIYVKNGFKKINITGKSHKILAIMMCGKNNNSTLNRKIRRDICDILRVKNCVSCGTSHDIEIDHKNDLYNDKRVLTLATQTLDDFQPLCRHCNLRKREVIKRAKETGIRPSAMDIPHLAPLSIKYVGNNTSDVLDVTSTTVLEGTYWHDPVEFMKKYKKSIDNELFEKDILIKKNAELITERDKIINEQRTKITELTDLVKSLNCDESKDSCDIVKDATDRAEVIKSS